jgi:hypothetical protein
MAPVTMIGEIAAVTVTEISANSLFGALVALASEASGQRDNSMSARAGHSPEEGSSARVGMPAGHSHPEDLRGAPMLAEG